MKILATLFVLVSFNAIANDVVILDCKTDDDLNVTFVHEDGKPELVTVKIEEEPFAKIIVNEYSIKKNNGEKLRICSGTGCGFKWPYSQYYYAKFNYNKEDRQGVYRFVDRRRDGEGRRREIKKVEVEACEAHLRLFK